MIFPTLKNKTFGYVNLNLESEKWMRDHKAENGNVNPLLNPSFCQKMLQDVHKKYGLDFSYGGWMEDRSFLWKGSYLEKEKNFIHLGVDLNVPAGTEVVANFNAKVVKIDNDYPDDGGWGQRIIVKHISEPLYFIFAHLDSDIKCQVGDKLVTGQVFAKVGMAPYNGNWYQHLHVQTISAKYYLELEKTGTWDRLDGYGSIRDIEINAKRFIDPIRFII